MLNSFSVEGKNILITGGTRGIGKAITIQLAESGARVIANFARNQKAADQLQGTCAEKSLDVQFCRADLTLKKGIDELIETLAEIQLDGIVFCAASGVHNTLEELTERHFDFTFAINVKAFFVVAKKLLPQMSQNSSIIGLSSEGAVHAYPTYSLVGASKGAMESLCRHMAVEFAEKGVRVNVLSPGSVLTEAWDFFPDKEERIKRALDRNPQKKMTTPEEVARTAHFLLSDASAGINGHTLTVDGGQRIRG